MSPRVLGVIALAAVGWGTAHASVSVAVLPIPGPQGAAARKAVMSAVRGGGIYLLDPRQVDRALGPTRPGSISGPALLVLASSTGAEVLLVGTCVKSPRGVSLRVLSGATGESLEQVFLPVKDAKYRTLDARAGAKLRARLLRGAAPAEPPPAPPPPAPPVAQARAAPPPGDAPVAASEPIRAQAAPTEPPAKSKAKSAEPEARVEKSPEPQAAPPRASHLPTVDVMAGTGFLHRQLSYTDDLFQALSTYQLPAGFTLQAEGTYYLLPNVGVEGRYHKEPVLASQDLAGDRLSTLSDGWELGGVFRWPLATPAGPIETTGVAGIGGQRFAVQAAPGAATSAVPGVSYVTLRIGAGARARVVDPVSALVGFDYLPVLHSGQVSSAGYFPRSSVGAIQARAGVAVAIRDPFEARLLVDYRRYFYAMNPKPGDPLIAGGALDEYVTLTAALAVRF